MFQVFLFFKPGREPEFRPFVNFTGSDDWIMFDWSDAYRQFGDITEYTVEDSANGKKLDIIFSVGLIGQGETFTLDPAIVDSYLFGGSSEAIAADNVKEKISISRAVEQLKSLYESILEKRRQ